MLPPFADSRLRHSAGLMRALRGERAWRLRRRHGTSAPKLTSQATADRMRRWPARDVLTSRLASLPHGSVFWLQSVCHKYSGGMRRIVPASAAADRTSLLSARLAQLDLRSLVVAPGMSAPSFCSLHCCSGWCSAPVLWCRASANKGTDSWQPARSARRSRSRSSVKRYGTGTSRQASST
jgi:hypothetical protein